MVEWMKPQINSAIWNIRKQKITNQNNKKKKESKKKNEDSVRSLWDNFKHSNIHIMVVLEGEERESKKLKTYLKKYWLKISLTWWKK